MSTLTPLGQQRADTVEINKAVRGLRQGAEPEQVVASLALHCGLTLPIVQRAAFEGYDAGWGDGYAKGYTEAEETWCDATHGLVQAARKPRRWWGR